MKHEDSGGTVPLAGAPPRTIEALRALTLDIGREDASVALGGKAHAVLARLVDMPEQAAVRSISELGTLLGVNASTLTRLAKRLGFAGFSDFQSVFRDAIADDKRYFYSRQVGRLLKAEKGPIAEIEPFERLAGETAANVQSFPAQLDPTNLEAAARILARARRVRVHGVRQFHSLASFLTYGLGMLRSDVALLDELSNGELFYSLAEARIIIESWRQYYNTGRPHSSLGYRPPAPAAMPWPAKSPQPASPAASYVAGKPTMH